MIKRHRTSLAALSGAFAMFALVSAAPASAAMESCPDGTRTYFEGSTIYLGQEGQTDIWSTNIDLIAYCGQSDAAHALANVTVLGVLASSNGTIDDLYASANGDAPNILLPVNSIPNLPIPGATLPVPAGTKTDANGHVSFPFRARSTTEPYLALPGGGTQLIGLQLDYAVGPRLLDNGTVVQDSTLYGGGGFFAATPELDSLALFGSGALGMAGYGMMRLRALRRRRD